MNQAISILIIVGGGLGMFLLGMKHLSEGLQAVSGSGLRRFMSIATTHRLAGVGTGVITTMIVQSSSIITVMVVGFVSSGLMNLSQAINVIIGSNIGTTASAAFGRAGVCLGRGGRDPEGDAASQERRTELFRAVMPSVARRP